VPAHWALKFFSIWVGQAVSLVGSGLVQFALVWWLTKKTGSATILATASLVALLPQIVLGPFVGAFVDRWNRRVIMIVADTGIAAATGVLLFLCLVNLVQVRHIYVILLVRSLGGAFHRPAMAASTSLMVPNRHLARVAGANQLLQGLIGILAPPLGALLLGLVSTSGVLMVDIATAAVAVSTLGFVSIPQPAKQAQANGAPANASYWQDLRAGFRYVLTWPGLLGLILLAMMLNFLLSPAGSLLPLLVMREFHGGALHLAWAESVFGVGIILGGILLSAWGGFKRRIKSVLVGIMGVGIGVLLSGRGRSRALDSAREST
jgi:DHA3 family macrolide efflux protein-like MFS transporter